MANTGVFDVDENFIRAWFRDRNLLVIDRSASFLNDLVSIS